MAKNNITAYIHGGQIPKGSVKVSGAKNSATKLLSASLISDEKVVLHNFPVNIVDAQYKIDFIRENGGLINIQKSNEIIEVDARNFTCNELDHYDYPIRTTYLLVAGMLKKSGIAKIPYPGGCKIGSRGYDLHIMIWEKFGAIVTEKENYIQVTVPSKLKPAEINFPISTIGGTENALITASTIEGTTSITNAYISPEVYNLIGFLRSMGSQIDVTGNSFIRVNGSKNIRGSIYKIIPDRIEALTWLVYGTLSRGHITIENVPFSSMEIPLTHIREAGIDYYSNFNNIYISPDCIENGIVQPFELACGTHPGIISDMQPFFTLLGLHAQGISRIFDYRYPERTQYCNELRKMYGNSIQWEMGKITTKGKTEPIGAIVQSTDLRGSMALILAALIAKGNTEVKNAEMALRGYNNLVEKLKGLGVEIIVE